MNWRKVHRNVNARLTLVSVQFNTEFVYYALRFC